MLLINYDRFSPRLLSWQRYHGKHVSSTHHATIVLSPVDLWLAGGLGKDLLAALQTDSAFLESVAAVGLHYPCNHPAPEVIDMGLKFWSSEGNNREKHRNIKSQGKRNARKVKPILSTPPGLEPGTLLVIYNAPTISDLWDSQSSTSPSTYIALRQGST